MGARDRPTASGRMVRFMGLNRTTITADGTGDVFWLWVHFRPFRPTGLTHDVPTVDATMQPKEMMGCIVGGNAHIVWNETRQNGKRQADAALKLVPRQVVRCPSIRIRKGRHGGVNDTRFGICKKRAAYDGHA